MKEVEYFWYDSDIDLPYNAIVSRKNHPDTTMMTKIVRVEGTDDINLWNLVGADAVDFNKVHFEDIPLYAYIYGGCTFFRNNVFSKIERFGSRQYRALIDITKTELADIVNYMTTFSSVKDCNEMVYILSENSANIEPHPSMINRLIKIPKTKDDIGEHVISDMASVKYFKYIKSVASIVQQNPDYDFSTNVMELYKNYWYLADHDTKPENVYRPLDDSKLARGLVLRDRKLVISALNHNIVRSIDIQEVKVLVGILYKTGIMDVTKEVFLKRKYISVTDKNKKRLSTVAIDIKDGLAAVPSIMNVRGTEVSFSEAKEVFGFKYEVDNFHWMTNSGSLDDLKYFKKYGIIYSMLNDPMPYQFVCSLVDEILKLSDTKRDKVMKFFTKNHLKTDTVRTQELYLLESILKKDNSEKTRNYIKNIIHEISTTRDISCVLNSRIDNLMPLILDDGIVKHCNSHKFLTLDVVEKINELSLENVVPPEQPFNRYLVDPSDENLSALTSKFGEMYDRLDIFGMFVHIRSVGNYNALLKYINENYPEIPLMHSQVRYSDSTKNYDIYGSYYVDSKYIIKKIDSWN